MAAPGITAQCPSCGAVEANRGGMRHVLVHDYFEVNWNRVFKTAREDVPALQLQLRNIIETLPVERDDLE